MSCVKVSAPTSSWALSGPSKQANTIHLITAPVRFFAGFLIFFCMEQLNFSTDHVIVQQIPTMARKVNPTVVTAQKYMIRSTELLSMFCHFCIKKQYFFFFGGWAMSAAFQLSPEINMTNMDAGTKGGNRVWLIMEGASADWVPDLRSHQIQEREKNRCYIVNRRLVGFIGWLHIT